MVIQEFFKGFYSYIKAIEFIFKHKFIVYLLVPGILNVIYIIILNFKNGYRRRIR